MSFQMTLDRLLFENHLSKIETLSSGCAKGAEEKTPLLRIYYSPTPWVTVGYAAEKKSGYALSTSKHALTNMPICRRITGGGTVIHGSDLIFSLLARKQDDSEKFESVETSYRHIHEAVKLAFQKLGKSAEFYKTDELESGRDCFLNPVNTDLYIDHRKVAGGAQKRSEDVFLHEESIQPPAGIRLEDLERELIAAFEAYFGITIERTIINPQILFKAEKLAPECIVKDSGFSTQNSDYS